ncbi:hypothetical protein J8273_1186 [Carpediemonas membranifera]|uniref:Uncharacterized protein n=1 Tax=Carpediemonas membranifera TaxID=201153 RepID=A0A8J6E4R4_9EUKA|nr:hypothetical protein J8273_1186 [Carpediemonas membranifera]|eukprot:KAG9397271.1 hypothetical protein J8273_1186 [Carpediemonas membranifera]
MSQNASDSSTAAPFVVKESEMTADEKKMHNAVAELVMAGKTVVPVSELLAKAKINEADLISLIYAKNEYSVRLTENGEAELTLSMFPSESKEMWGFLSQKLAQMV